jgi:hypothetical protein
MGCDWQGAVDHRPHLSSVRGHGRATLDRFRQCVGIGPRGGESLFSARLTRLRMKRRRPRIPTPCGPDDCVPGARGIIVPRMDRRPDNPDAFVVESVSHDAGVAEHIPAPGPP